MFACYIRYHVTCSVDSTIYIQYAVNLHIAAYRQAALDCYAFFIHHYIVYFIVIFIFSDVTEFCATVRLHSTGFCVHTEGVFAFFIETKNGFIACIRTDDYITICRGINHKVIFHNSCHKTINFFSADTSGFCTSFFQAYCLFAFFNICYHVACSVDSTIYIQYAVNLHIAAYRQATLDCYAFCIHRNIISAVSEFTDFCTTVRLNFTSLCIHTKSELVFIILSKEHFVIAVSRIANETNGYFAFTSFSIYYEVISYFGFFCCCIPYNTCSSCFQCFYISCICFQCDCISVFFNSNFVFSYTFACS